VLTSPYTVEPRWDSRSKPAASPVWRAVTHFAETRRETPTSTSTTAPVRRLTKHLAVITIAFSGCGSHSPEKRHSVSELVERKSLWRSYYG